MISMLMMVITMIMLLLQLMPNMRRGEEGIMVNIITIIVITKDYQTTSSASDVVFPFLPMSSNGRIIHVNVVYTEYKLVDQNNRFRHAPLKLVLLLTA